MKADELKSVLIGTPSVLDSKPYELAKALLAKTKHLFSYDDYLLTKEAEHPYDAAREDAELKEVVTWLRPLKDVAFSMPNTRVVGHPALFSALNSTDAPTNRVRSNLQLQPDTKFLFVSGSKDTEADKSLIKALLASKHPNVWGNMN